MQFDVAASHRNSLVADYARDAEWRRDPGWPNLMSGFPVALPDRPHSSPVLANLDEDAELEIALTDAAGRVRVHEANGATKTGWPIDLGDLPYGAEIRLDAIAVAYTAGLAALIGVVMGLIPMAAIAPASLTGVLREEGRASSAGRCRSRFPAAGARPCWRDTCASSWRPSSMNRWVRWPRC